jgi:hypothetical protein
MNMAIADPGPSNAPPRPRYRTVNWVVPVALFPPSEQLTVAVAGPGRRVLGLQVQDTVPLQLAVCVRLWLLPESDPGQLVLGEVLVLLVPRPSPQGTGGSGGR